MAWRLRCPRRSSLTPGLHLLRQLLAREVHVRQGMSRRVLHSACEPRDEAVLHVRHHHQAPNGWHDLAVFLVSVWHRPVSLRYLASLQPCSMNTRCGASPPRHAAHHHCTRTKQMIGRPQRGGSGMLKWNCRSLNISWAALNWSRPQRSTTNGGNCASANSSGGCATCQTVSAAPTQRAGAKHTLYLSLSMNRLSQRSGLPSSMAEGSVRDSASRDTIH